VRQNLNHDRPLLVALTGYGQAEDQRAAFEAGYDAHLVKPLNRGALCRLLEERFRKVESGTN
jgi:CheY-like chemotaxis protein